MVITPKLQKITQFFWFARKVNSVTLCVDDKSFIIKFEFLNYFYKKAWNQSRLYEFINNYTKN